MTAEKITELSGHSNPIYTLELSQKPGILFTGGNDKGLVEWSLKTNSFIKVMFPVPSSVYAIHCPAGYPLMFPGLRSGEVLIFDFIKQQLLPSLKHHVKPVFDIKSIVSKKELLVASEDGNVSVWNLDTLQLLHTIKVSHDTIRSIAISPDEKQIAFGCRDGQIKIYDSSDYSLITAFEAHPMAIFSLQFANDGSYLISGARDAQLRIWDSGNYTMIKNIPAHLFAVNHICFHPTQPYFASASMDKTIKIWNAEDFKLDKIISREKGYACHRLSINKLAWNGDDLISTSDDKTVMVWRIGFE